MDNQEESSVHRQWHLWELPWNNTVVTRDLENISKDDFNRTENVEFHRIDSDPIQARNYEVPVANVITENDNGDELIVDALPLPWYARVPFWKICLVVLVANVLIIATIFLTQSLPSSPSDNVADDRMPTLPKGTSTRTSMPTLSPFYLTTNWPFYAPAVPLNEEYLVMQRTVLEQIYIETGGDYSWTTDSSSWLNDDISVCEWYGCECNNNEDYIVTSVRLGSFRYTQLIPTAIGMLSKLQNLTINGDKLTGTLPSELFNLHELTQLTIRGSLEGTLPSEISNLRSLQILDLRGNNFDGKLPSEVGVLGMLKYLDISGMTLKSSIPSEVFNLSSLQYLYMNNSSLEGTLPSELFGMVSLQIINLSNNNLIGSLPLSMDLVSLREIDLSENKISGILPDAFASLPHFEILRIRQNNLKSIQPGLLSNGNESVSSRLSIVNIELNEIEFLPTNFVRLPTLSIFRVGANRIEGLLPMFENVAEISLAFNSMYGSIPTEYGLLGNLTSLQLDNNPSISGTVPTELTGCDQLNLISIFDTGIAGNISFCDSFSENFTVSVRNASICGEECDCCCVDTFIY